MNSGLRFNPDICTGCRNCEVACHSVFRRDSGVCHAVICVESDPFTGRNLIRVCRQCDAAPCAVVCPVNAITQNTRTGAWEIDYDICTECGICVEACPFHSMFRNLQVPVKCDLCHGDPECVKACRFQALQFLPGKFAIESGVPKCEQSADLGRGS